MALRQKKATVKSHVRSASELSTSARAQTRRVRHRKARRKARRKDGDRVVRGTPGAVARTAEDVQYARGEKKNAELGKYNLVELEGVRDPKTGRHHGQALHRVVVRALEAEQRWVG